MKLRFAIAPLAGMFFVMTGFGQKIAPATRPLAVSPRPTAAASKPTTVLPPEKQGQWQGGVFTSTVAPSQNYNAIFPAPATTTMGSTSSGSGGTASPMNSSPRPAVGTQATSTNASSWASTLNSLSGILSLWGAASSRPGGYNVAASDSTPSGYGPSRANSISADPNWGQLLSIPQQDPSPSMIGGWNGTPNVSNNNGTDPGRYRVDLGQYQTAAGQPPSTPRPGGPLGADVSLWPARPNVNDGWLSPVEHEPCGVGEFCDPLTGHPIEHANENMSGEDLLEKLGEQNAEMEAATLQPPSMFFTDILGAGDFTINPEDFHTAFGWLGSEWGSVLDGGGFGLGGYFELHDPAFTFDFGTLGFGGGSGSFGSADFGYGGLDFGSVE